MFAIYEMENNQMASFTIQKLDKNIQFSNGVWKPDCLQTAPFRSIENRTYPALWLADFYFNFKTAEIVKCDNLLNNLKINSVDLYEQFKLKK